MIALGFQMICFLTILTASCIVLGPLIAARYRDDSQHPAAWERILFRLCGIDGREEMRWDQYAKAFVTFNVLSCFVVYIAQRLQSFLPLNPQDLGAVTPDSAFNTAISFASNTNWQGYGGESTMSYFTQMLILGVQNFVSAAAGIAVLFAFLRGFTRVEKKTIGNFWRDLLWSTLALLLPLSFCLAVGLMSQGVVQTFSGPETVTTLEGQQQIIARGPVASQVAIKQLGTNGGGFFNANSAHPLENPTPLSNFLQCLAILLIPGSLCFTFGKAVGNMRQGWVIYASMMGIFLLFLIPTVISEIAPNAGLSSLPLDHRSGNMEGKEVRFGSGMSALWAVATTAASNGSVNSMHDSFSPLGGLFPLLLMQLGEVVFGGVGSGLYGMLTFAIVTVFLAGLMVGRTPEYLGKKIEIFEMKMASLIILIPCALTLVATSLGVALESGRASVSNPAAHGLSQVLYAYSSMSNNNGSAFAGFAANVPIHNYLGGVCMFLSRYFLAIPALAIAGSLAAKKSVPVSLGTLRTDTALFALLLVSVVLLVGALTFIPALALGPIAEHLSLGASL